MVKLVDTKDLNPCPGVPVRAAEHHYKNDKTIIISDINSKSIKIKKQIIKILKKESKKSNLVIVIGRDGFIFKLKEK